MRLESSWRYKIKLLWKEKEKVVEKQTEEEKGE